MTNIPTISEHALTEQYLQRVYLQSFSIVPFTRHYLIVK